jgi:glycosyltransferase involved in cell wall biosynthesis
MPVRILMVLDKPFRTDLRVEREIKALVGAGHRVTLLCERMDGEAERDEWNGAAVWRINSSRNRLSRWAHYLTGTLTGRSRGWEGAIEAGAAEQSSEVIHAHDLPVATSALRVARRRGAAFVFDRHENWAGLLAGLRDDFPAGLRRKVLWSSINSPAIWRHWEKRIVREADLVITVSREAGLELPSSPRDLEVVSNYVDLDTLPATSPAPPATRPLRLCFSGVLNAMFALADTVRAISLLPPGSTELIFVGDGDDMASLVSLVRELGLEPFVHFQGWRPRDEALATIQESHLCLLPLRDNALTRTTVGNKLFEYMGLGRPVLCSAVGVMARLVRETGAGVIVEPWTGQTVAAAVADLSDRPERLAAMGGEGARAVRTVYNWGRERESLLRAYNRLERNRSGARV